MKFKDTHLRIVLVTITIILVVLPVIRKIHRQRNTAKIALAMEQKRKRIFSSWEECNYIPIVTSGTNLSQILDSIKIHQRSILDSKQEEELLDTFKNLLMAFTEGNYDTYLKFLKPVPSSINKARYSLIVQALSGKPMDIKGPQFTPPPELRGRKYVFASVNTNAITPPLDPDECLKLVFARCSRSNYYRGWWEKICLEKTLAFIERTTNTPIALPTRIFSLGITNFGTNFWGLQSYDTMPIYLPAESVRDVLKKDGNVLFASTHWLIALKEPDLVTPFLLRFYWSKTYEKWVPFEFSTGNGYKKSVITPFF